MTKAIIKNILYDLQILPEGVDIEDNEDMLDKYLIDSFKFIEMIVMIEEKFEIELDDDDILVERFSNIETICNMVQRKIDQIES